MTYLTTVLFRYFNRDPSPWEDQDHFCSDSTISKWDGVQKKMQYLYHSQNKVQPYI